MAEACASLLKLLTRFQRATTCERGIEINHRRARVCTQSSLKARGRVALVN